MEDNKHSTINRYVKPALLCLVIILVSFIALYVRQVNNLADKVSSDAAKGSVPASIATPRPDGRAKAGQLVITEWGIKLPVTGELAAANYRFGAKSKDDAFISTVAADAVAACRKQLIEEPSSSTEQAITRHNLTDMVEGVPGYLGTVTATQAALKAPQNFKQISDHVYQFSTGNNVYCDRAHDLRPALAKAFQELTAVK